MPITLNEKEIDTTVNYFLDELLKAVADEREDEAQAFRKTIAPTEAKFEKAMKVIFRKQEKEVMKTMKPLNKTKWNKILKDIGFPFMKKAADLNGQRVFNDLPIPEKSIKADTVAAISFNMEYPEALARLKKQATKYSIAVNETTNEKIRKILADGIESGEPVKLTALKISQTFTEFEISRSLLIARTETSRAANYGAVSAYKQSGVVEGKEWLTAQDEKVCPYCLDMDAQVESLNDAFMKRGDRLTVPQLDENGKPIEGDTVTMENDYLDVEAPPLHGRCRCTVIPVLKEL